ISSAHEGIGVSETDAGGWRTLTLADRQNVRGRAVVVASGADYRRLPADNAEHFEGLGLYYAATHIEALQTSGEDVVVAGGGKAARPARMNARDPARHTRP